MRNFTSPEVAVLWTPQHLQSNDWYNVPIGQQRHARFEVLPRIGKELRVTLVPSPSPWLRVHPTLGKVPFRGTVIIDTTDLQAGRSYSTILSFQYEGTEIHQEHLRVITTRPPDANPNTIPGHLHAPGGEIRRTLGSIGCTMTLIAMVVSAVLLGLLAYTQ